MHFWIEGVYLLGLPRVGMRGKEAPWHGDHDGEGSNEIPKNVQKIQKLSSEQQHGQGAPDSF